MSSVLTPKRLTLRILAVCVLSFALLGSSLFTMVSAQAASSKVKIWAVPTISFIDDGKDQIVKIHGKVETGNHVEEIRLIVDEGTPNEREYVFEADGTIISADDGLVSVECKSTIDSDGYAIGPGQIKCTVKLDKEEFGVGIHPIKVELVLDIGTLTDTAKFTLKAKKSNLADLQNQAFAARSTVERGDSYSVLVTEKNQGAIAAGGHWVKIYLSSNTNRDGGDVVVGQKYVPHIGKGAVKHHTINVNIPGGYPVGPEFFISYLYSENIIGESNEGNNQRNKAITVTS
jgi:hypothetical protein